jgi:hypothetical protein
MGSVGQPGVRVQLQGPQCLGHCAGEENMPPDGGGAACAASRTFHG